MDDSAERGVGAISKHRLQRISCSLFICSGVIGAASSCQKHLDVSPKAERGALVHASAVSLRAGAAKDDGQWRMPGKNYENTRFSEQEQISASNVKDLHVVWSRSTEVKRGHEAAPLAVDDTLFVVTPYPNHLLAFDMKAPGSPPKWQYTPQTIPAAQGVACCDVVNRGAA